jgi:hypothetical protein
MMNFDQLKAGDNIYSDWSGKTLRKVTAINASKEYAVVKGMNPYARQYRIERESLEKNWSIGRPEHGWYTQC